MILFLCGREVLIDSEDKELLEKYTWTLDAQHGHSYFISHEGKGKDRITIRMHRILAGAAYKDGCYVDHINGNTLDNRKENLRKVTPTQNNWNRGISSKNKTGYKGVTFNPLTNKYRASFQCNGNTIFCGYFDTKEEAFRAYLKKSKEHRDGFDRIPF